MGDRNLLGASAGRPLPVTKPGRASLKSSRDLLVVVVLVVLVLRRVLQAADLSARVSAAGPWAGQKKPGGQWTPTKRTRAKRSGSPPEGADAKRTCTSRRPHREKRVQESIRDLLWKNRKAPLLKRTGARLRKPPRIKSAGKRQ